MPNNALAKIRARAKQLRARDKNIGWIGAIKKASKQLKSEGKIGPKKKPASYRQTGTSSAYHDKKVTARAPGARIPKGGKKVTYYERRKNRSDKPGSLTGITPKARVKKQLGNALLDYELCQTISGTKQARKRILKYRKQYRSL